MSNDTTQHTPADVRGRIIRASILPIEDEETMIARLRAGAEAVERGELDAEDFAGIWSQYLRELLRASSVPAPADARERVAKIVREAMEDARRSERLNTFLQSSMWDYTDRILALLRTPSGEGKAVRLLGLAMERAELLCQDAGRAEWPLSDFGRDMLQARLDTVRDLIGDALAALRSEASGQGGIHPDPETWRCRQCGGYAAHYRDCPALRSEAPASGWSEVRERANMLRAVLREHGFEYLRSALVGQHSDAVCYGQWERHKALLRDLLDALDAALRSGAQGGGGCGSANVYPTDRSESDAD